MPPTEDEAVARLLLQVGSPACCLREKATSAPRPLEAGTASSAASEGEAPTADPSAAAAAPGSEEPQPGAYLKAGDGIFIKLPWASSSRAPVEGEVLDGEMLASAGLSLVDAPSSSSDKPEEERLLRKLLSLYRARQAKLESREALVTRAGVDIEKRAEELRGLRQETLRSLAEERE